MLGGLYQRQQALGLKIPDVVATDSPIAARLLAFAGVRFVVVGPDKVDHRLQVLDDIIIRTRLGYSMVVSVDEFIEAILVATKIVVDFGLPEIAVLPIGATDWDTSAELVTRFLKGEDFSMDKPKIKVANTTKYKQVLEAFFEIEEAEIDPLVLMFDPDSVEGATPLVRKVGDVYEITDEPLAESIFMLYKPDLVFEVDYAKQTLEKLTGGEEDEVRNN